MNKASLNNFEDYFCQFPAEVQEKLQQIRVTIQKAAPNAIEVISYQMPTFKQNKNLVHFAAFKKHIGFYPGASGVAKFQKEISNYKNAKGSIQFPLDSSIPLSLIEQITKFRVAENLAKSPKKE